MQSSPNEQGIENATLSIDVSLVAYIAALIFIGTTCYLQEYVMYLAQLN